MTLLRTQLGNTLRGHRLRQRRTLRDVSGAARVSLGYLSEVERGQKEASSELLASICDALDVELADLLAEVSLEMRLAEPSRRTVRPVALAGVGPGSRPGAPDDDRGRRRRRRAGRGRHRDAGRRAGAGAGRRRAARPGRRAPSRLPGGLTKDPSGGSRQAGTGSRRAGTGAAREPGDATRTPLGVHLLDPVRPGGHKVSMSSPGSRSQQTPHPSLPVPTAVRGGVTVLEADAAEAAAAEAAATAGQHLTTPVPTGAFQPPAPGLHLTAPVPSLSVAVPPARPTHAAPRDPRRPVGRPGVAMSRTRRGLLTGARTAFAERGLKKTTMQHVAAAAGVAKATLYNHFRTKDDVAQALVAFELDRLAALAAELPLTVAVPALAEEVGAHPVLRRLAETEPETLVQMMGLDADRWGDVVLTLGSALRISRPEAELVCRWLLGLVLQPGTAPERAAQAAVVTGQLVG
jgi:AcrR family transcriptional regulator/transcriptional regulator with XRE-family HTH domain